MIPPANTGDTPSSLKYGSACLGMTGRTIPNPKRSMKTVKKTIRRANRGGLPSDTGCDVMVNSLIVNWVERQCRRLV